MQQTTVITRRTWLGLLNVVLATAFSQSLAQARRARLGWLALVSLSSPGVRTRFDAFLTLMQRKGWTEAGNLDFEPRGPAPGTTLSAAAAELVALKPHVIVSSGTPALTILRDLTTEIPIVMAGAGDPVGTGLVASLARPGGNITGVSWQLHELIPKTLSLLHEMAPGVARLDFLNQTNDPGHEFFAKVTVDAARKLGLTCQALQVGSANDVLAAIAASKADGVVMLATQMIYAAPQRIAAEAIRRGLPLAITGGPGREPTAAGFLFCYCANSEEMLHRTVDCVDRILRGARPADMPVQQPTRYDFVINLKTVRSIGLTVPQALLLRADEVIE